jgi:class 3 adenylate cyclase/CHASE2 domain-containing sensor protein
MRSRHKRRETGIKQTDNHAYEAVDAAALRPLSRWQRIRVLGIYLLLPALFIYAVQATGALDYLEQKAFSLRMGIYTARNRDLTNEARKRIVLVPISDTTFRDPQFRRLGRPPVPRSYHARVIRELRRAGAAVIVFDMLFDLPQAHDNSLVAAAREANAASTPVVWACFWSRDQQRLIFPLSQLQEASPHMGHTRTPYAAQEPQVNRFETYMRNSGRTMPALSVEAVRLAFNEPLPVWRGNMWRAGSLAIPANRDGTFTISFFGRAEETFPLVPYEQIYNGAVDDPAYRANRFFENKIVVIGDVTRLGNDYHPSPIGTMAGLEIHAHAMATLLENAFVHQAPAWTNTLALGLMALLAYLIATVCPVRYVIPLTATALLLYFMANLWLFSDAALNVELVAPLLVTVLVTLCAVTERGWREERERKRVRSALDQYVSPQLAASGAPTGTVTLVFADLEGSSALSENHGAAFEKVRAIYFGLLRDAVRRWNGFEVETAGDSLFAVFAVAADAVQFAVDAQLSMARQTWPGEVGAIRVRIGMHTGEPFMGRDRNRLTYRGPATNRAARVTSVARGGQILLSEATRNAIETARDSDVPPHITVVNRGQHTLRGVGAENLFQACHAELPCDFVQPADESPTPHSSDADLSPDLAALLKSTDTDANTQSSL